MEFGDREIFGISVEVNENNTSEWLFGKFCYWINCEQIGDFDLGTSLREVLFEMKWIVNDRGNRSGDNLCRRPLNEVFVIIDQALYESDEPSVSEADPLEMPARFEIVLPIDVFGSWKSYLVGCENYDWFLYKNVEKDDLKFFKTPRSVFDSVVTEVYRYLEDLYQTNLRNAT